MARPLMEELLLLEVRAEVEKAQELMRLPIGMRVTAEVTEQMEITAAMLQILAELDRAPLPASLAKPPANCTLEAVAEDVGH